MIVMFFEAVLLHNECFPHIKLKGAMSLYENKTINLKQSYGLLHCILTNTNNAPP